MTTALKIICAGSALLRLMPFKNHTLHGAMINPGRLLFQNEQQKFS